LPTRFPYTTLFRSWVDHVVNTIEAADQVVFAVLRNLVCGTLDEFHVRQTRALGQLSGGSDTPAIVVDAEKSGFGIRLSHGYGGLASSTPYVANRNPFLESGN